VVYRRYASLYVLAGVDGDENALAALEVVHAYVEALDRYFGAVCELDIMFHLEKAHYILDEMIMNGFVVETNRLKVLQPVQLLDAQTK
jgi:AP-4 complex subunit sigma-1